MFRYNRWLMAVAPKIAIPPQAEGDACGEVQLEQLLQVACNSGKVKIFERHCQLSFPAGAGPERHLVLQALEPV